MHPTSAGHEAEPPFAREVAATVEWVVALLASRPSDDPSRRVFREAFKTRLERQVLASDWSPGQPLLGSGTRAIVCDGPGRIDPSVAGAAAAAHLELELFAAARWQLWLDPGSVEVRIGDRGPVTTLFSSTPSSPKLRSSAPSFSPRTASPPPGLSSMTQSFHANVDPWAFSPFDARSYEWLAPAPILG